MKKSTQSGETVYRDCTEICNKGEARYRLKLVENYQWTLTEEFAADVCGLTVKFRNSKDKKTYFDFLNYSYLVSILAFFPHCGAWSWAKIEPACESRLISCHRFSLRVERRSNSREYVCVRRLKSSPKIVPLKISH